jgi:hypothetical protein
MAIFLNSMVAGKDQPIALPSGFEKEDSFSSQFIFQNEVSIGRKSNTHYVAPLTFHIPMVNPTSD